MDSGSLDVSDLYSTDAEIHFYHLRLLEDDLGYFPRYEAVILYRRDLERRAPAVIADWRKLEGNIDNDSMIAMNARAKLDRVAEARVAADFLRDRLGILVTVRETTWIRQLLRNTVDHLFLVFVSLATAVVVAVPLGIWARRRPRIGQAILATVGILQTIPSMAILVFMVPLLGLGAWPAIVALFFYSLLPIVRNTYQGLMGIAPSLRESADVLGLTPRARLWLIDIPLASPAILAGIKTAAVINVGTATIGALIGAGGFGQPILTGIRLADTALILQGAVPAAVLAIAVQAVFEAGERWVVPQGLRLR
jgi:osmoprotectant transport system permease protein